MGVTPYKCGLFIGGEVVGSAAGSCYERENPATGEVVSVVAEGGEEDVARAVEAAREAFPAWSATPPAERARLVARIADAVEAERERLAVLNTRETGKPYRESHGVELRGVIRTFRYYGGLLPSLSGRTIQASDVLVSITRREPVGVVGQIVPWNFPLLLASWKIAPALLAGCTVVVKPSELTPSATVELARMAASVGVPPGVINVVPGRGEVAGRALVDHPDVAKVAFTGSTEVGKEIMARAARGLKRVSLELGGKAPNIVFDDVDIDDCIEANLRGGFFNQGENCTAVTRLLVHGRIYEPFVERFVERVRAIRMGDPMDEKTEIGALISRDHLERVSRYCENAVQEGGVILTGGAQPSDEELREGYFFMPTVIDNVKPTHTIACEEVFGPVVAVMPFGAEEEAVEIANSTVYGLAGGVWSRDIKRALRVAAAVRAGYIWVNTYGGILPETPYGGFKQSGMGKELGEEGLDNYLETKTINIYLGERVPRWYGL